jgi:hypothetical protein
MNSGNNGKLTLEDVIRQTPGVTNLYDMFGPASMYNLRRTDRALKYLLEDEFRKKFVKEEETKRVYLVVTQRFDYMQERLITTKEYFSPSSIYKYYWNFGANAKEFYNQLEVQKDMSQKMMEGKCFINYKIPNPTVYIFAFKLHGCEELN